MFAQATQASTLTPSAIIFFTPSCNTLFSDKSLADGPHTIRTTLSNHPCNRALWVYIKQTFSATSGSLLVQTTASRCLSGFFISFALAQITLNEHKTIIRERIAFMTLDYKIS